MKLLWNLDYGDLIVLSAKQSGAYDDGRYNNTCYLIQPSGWNQQQDHEHEQNQSKRQGKLQKVYKHLDEYIASEYRAINLDYLLYDIVNASLDRTIALLGRDNVDRTERQLRVLRKWVESQCQREAIFPCSSNGTRQVEESSKNCYWYDSGCGFACVDRVLASYNIRAPGYM